ncbi:MAG: hypothetical protein ACJA1I_000555 [Zhongshania marina]|jgi:hypothetical protein
MKLEFIQTDITQTYFVRGHVDFSVLSKLVEAEEEMHHSFEKMKHSYLRARPDSTGEYSTWYDEVDGPARGAFPVTMNWRDW